MSQSFRKGRHKISLIRSTTIVAAMGALLAGLLALSCKKSTVSGSSGTSSTSLRTYYRIPPFELTNQHGQPTTLDDLKGHVWVADFIFTRCPATCPTQTKEKTALMTSLKGKQGEAEVRMVSITVDPLHDTPTVLRDYAQSRGATSENWLFLTGDKDTIWKLSEEGFRLPVGEDKESSPVPVYHSEKLLLIDRTGQVRGL